MGIGRHGAKLGEVSPTGSRQDLFTQGSCSDDPMHFGVVKNSKGGAEVEILSRRWLEADHTGTFQSASPWKCCHVLCQTISQRWSGGLRADDLSAHERRQKAQEWTNVFSDAEPDSGAMSLASSFDQEVAVELDVQAFQHEEVSVMDVESSSTRTTLTLPRNIAANDGAPLGQASV